MKQHIYLWFQERLSHEKGVLMTAEKRRRPIRKPAQSSSQFNLSSPLKRTSACIHLKGGRRESLWRREATIQNLPEGDTSKDL